MSSPYVQNCVHESGRPYCNLSSNILKANQDFELDIKTFFLSAQVVKERKQWWYGGVAKKCNFASSSGIWMAAVLVERRALMEKKRADAHHANYSITILTDGSSSASGTANEENLQGEKTAFACQGTRLHLKCLNQSEVIKVTRANYGRFSIAVCNDKSMTTWSVNCFSSKAKEVFANKSVPQKIYLLSFF